MFNGSFSPLSILFPVIVPEEFHMFEEIIILASEIHCVGISAVIGTDDSLLTKDARNEHISKIRYAFISQFSEDVAKEYLIVRNTDGVMKVNLSPDMIIWE